LGAADGRAKELSDWEKVQEGKAVAWRVEGTRPVLKISRMASKTI